MGNNAIGASLEIPQSVLDNLNKVDKKLQDIATTADTMSKNVIASFNNIGTQGVDSLLTKINQLQNGIGSIDFGKITNGLNSTQGQFTTNIMSAEQLADAIAKAVEQLGKLRKPSTAPSGNILPLTQEMAKVPHTVNEAIEQIKNLQKAVRDVDFNKEWKDGKAFDVVNQRINDLKANLKSMQTIKVSPQSALSMDGSSIEKRIAQNKQLTIARSQLNNTDKNYEKTLAQLNAKILENNKANAQAVAGSKELKKQHNSLIDTSSQLARKMALIFSVSQITGYINNMISVRGEMELQQRSLEAILQNKTKADAIYQQITDLAVRSPFTIQELTSYTKQLAAYRIETEKLYDTTKMLADISAGLGVDMQRLILAFGQVKAANYLRGQELRQFSEAGINILGELADYFGELNNRVYSTADVFDMVSKRMVKFSDVEEVFKRLTSAGGIFYNMQEIQAETLKGQLSNLRDTLDVMFNEIGKANDGVLKDSVAFVRSLVQNWEIFADVLKFLVVPTFAAYAGYIILTTANKYKLIAANTIEITQMNALQRATIKTIASYKNLIAMMKANAGSFIWGGSVTAIAAIGVGIYEWSKRVDANKAKYDELNKSIYSNLDGINASMDAMLKQSSIIDSNNKLIASNTLNEQENKNAQEQVNKATNQRNILIKKFAEEYPDYYQQIKSQLETTDDIKAAQERLNRQMKLTNNLMFEAKAQEGWFSDGFMKNMEDAEEAFSKVRLAGGDTEAAFQEMRNTVRDLAQQGKISQELKNNIEDIIKAEDTTYNKGIKLRKIIYSTTGNERPFAFAALRGVDDLIDNYILALNKSKKAVEDFRENASSIVRSFMTQEKIYEENQIEKVSETRKKAILNDAINFLSSWKNSSDDVKQILVDEFANFGINIPLSFTFETGNKEDDFLTNQINDYLQKNVGTVKLNSLGITFASGAGKEYLEQNIAITKELRKELEQTEKATTQLNKDKTNAQRIKEIKDELNVREGLTKAVGLYNESVVKGGTKGEDIDKSRLSLLKELRSQYEDLLKYYTQEEAAQKVYKNNQKEIARLGLQVNEMTKYELSEYLKLLHTLKQTPDVLKEISKTETLIDVKIKEDSIKKAQDDIDKLFGDYEYAVSVDESGIDTGLLSNIFSGLGLGEIDLSAPSISDTFKQTEDIIKKLRNENTQESVKLADEAEKKLRDKKIKYAEDVAKKYTEYAKKSISERLNIELKAAKEIAQAKEEQGITGMSDTQVQSVIEKIQQDKQKALDALSWKDFKESGLYTKMFEDLEYVSTSALEKIQQRLMSMRKELSNLDPSEVKEIVSSMEKIDEQIVKRNPFKGLTKDIKEYLDYAKQKKEIESQWIESSDEEKNIKARYEYQEKVTNASREAYNLAVEKYGADSKQAREAKELLSMNEKLLDVDLKRLVAQGKITQALADQIRDGEKATKSLSDRITEISQYLGEFSNELPNIASDLENVFGMMDDKTKDTIDSISEITGGLSQTGQGVARVVSGDIIGGGIQAAAGVAKTIGAIFAIGDKRKEREIQRQIEKVNDLQKAYEKLGKAIEKAYSFDQLKASNEQAQANIKAQIASYEQMIASEEAKKKTDKGRIKEWRENIEDLKEQAEELKQTELETLGGIGEKVNEAAQEFIDAWYEAFKETGDGLDALEDKWDEYIDTIIKKQMMLKFTANYLKPLFKAIDDMFAEDSEGGVEVTKNELKNTQNLADATLPKLNEDLKNFAEMIGYTGAKASGELSGLQKGIQGVTEETAQALESLLNSMRFFVADSNKQLQDICQAITSADENSNPILAELRLQTAQVQAINKLLNSVSKAGHSKGGYGLKVFLD